MVLGLAAWFVSPLPTRGAFILSPAAVIGSDLGAFAPTTALTNMINQSGIDKPFVSGSTDFAPYFAFSNRAFAQNGGTNNWQSDFSFDLPLNGFVDFDLGGSYLISGMAIWNLSVRDVTVKIYEELNGPEQIAGNFTLTNHLSFPFSYSPDVLSFAQSRPGRYVRLAITSAYKFTPSDTFAYAIVGEVVMAASQLSGPAPLSIQLTAAGDVTVTFLGALQRATVLNGQFEDVIGAAQNTHTIARTNLLTRQYFRSRSN